ncbi:YaeQ family protein [Lacisediminimonas profundi]|uniref:YaeQ family protein n=1 Tax=Lacisediminimonas profundi TaxID=2603856 RepID=UPI00124B08D9|nr:YaeQ family protein [Lacisediminimonas profundi]
MAIKSTIYKASLQIANMDRGYYGDHSLIIARHPSETDERMMMRVLAFALNADEALAFGKGLSDEDEPDLWQKDLTGAIEKWIEVGQPDDKRLLKASGRSDQVLLYCYSSTCDIWWKQIAGKVERARNLCVMKVPSGASMELAALAQRTMQLQCTVQDGQIWLGDGEKVVQLELITLKDFNPQR